MIINQREIKFSAILSGSANPVSEFESETFSFIKDWLQETGSFKLHTSGSTGTPKEITLTRFQLEQSAKRTIQALDLNQHDTAFVCLDTKYIAGKMMLARALEADMNIVAVEPSSNPIQKLPDQQSIDFAAFVPMQLREMVKDARCVDKLNTMKAILVGGGVVHASLEQEIKKLSCPVYATFGMTETVSHIALQRLNGKEASDRFNVLPGIEIATDERGCLIIYIPEFPEKIVTNDVVELLTPRSFRWVGRADNVINSGGFKISPEKVEKIIETILPGRSFFITSVPDERLGQKLILVIEGNTLNAETSFLEELKQELHTYEVPKEIRYVLKFIRTETGKIKRDESLRFKV